MEPNSFNTNFSLSSFFKTLDKKSDRIPVITTFTNSLVIFQKTVVIPLLNQIRPSLIQENHYLKYIDNKKLSDCFLLMIPGVGAFLYLKKMATKPKQADLVKNERLEKETNKVKERLERLEKRDIIMDSFLNKAKTDLEKIQNSIEKGFSEKIDLKEKASPEEFILHFEAETNKRLNLILGLNETSYAPGGALKALIKDCKVVGQTDLLDPKKITEIKNHLNEQYLFYKDLHQNLVANYEFQIGQMLKIEKLKKSQPSFPVDVANLLSPERGSTIKIENKEQLDKLLETYKKYFQETEKCIKNLEDMIRTKVNLKEELASI